MQNMRELVGDLSQTNHYMVSFSTLNSTLMSYIQNRIGFQEDVRNFLSRKTGLLCAEASLPTSSMATAEVRDNFMGIPQEFAHTRLYTDIDFTFYVDSNYLNLRIFEAWMDYIAGGSEINELSENYYRRMNYPDNYKVQTMFISKFERDFNSQIDYQFINAFPKLVTAIPVSYGAADLLKVTVSFTYDRYIVNPKGSIKKANTSGFNDIARNNNDTTNVTSIIQDEGGFNQEDSAIFNDPVAPPVPSDPFPSGRLPGSDGIVRTFPANNNTVPRGAFSVTPNAAASTDEFVRRDNLIYNNTVPEGSFGGSSKPKAKRAKHFGQAFHDFFFGGK